MRRADLLILATPHREYRSLASPETTAVVDIRDVYGKGASLKRDPAFRPRNRDGGAD